jgi:hypothetical protein
MKTQVNETRTNESSETLSFFWRKTASNRGFMSKEEKILPLVTPTQHPHDLLIKLISDIMHRSLLQ